MRNGMMFLGWATVATLLVPTLLEAQVNRPTLEWDGEIRQGRTLRIQGISGDIRASLAPGSKAQVRGEKRGRERDFEAVRILVDEGPEGVTVCAVYFRPEAEDCDSRHDYDDDDRGHRDIRVSVDFEVWVPAGVDFRPSMVSGEVAADGLESDIFASTVSGAIRLSTSGVAEASTVSGLIEADIGSADLVDLDFKTVSGDIRVSLPSGADADVRFSSLSGDFDTDLPLEVSRRRERFVGSSLRGQLGNGGPQLTFQTVSGDVELRRRRE